MGEGNLRGLDKLVYRGYNI